MAVVVWEVYRKQPAPTLNKYLDNSSIVLAAQLNYTFTPNIVCKAADSFHRGDGGLGDAGGDGGVVALTLSIFLSHHCCIAGRMNRLGRKAGN